MKKNILLVIAFVFSLAVGFFATDITVKYISVKQNLIAVGNTTEPTSVSAISATEQTQPIASGDSPGAVTANTETATANANTTPKPIPLDLEFEIKNKKLNSNKFDFTVSCKNLPQGVTIQSYSLYMKNDTVAAMTQADADGAFKNVDYKSADGKYLLCAVTSENRLSVFKEVSGFVKPVEVKKIEKMSKAELQNLLDNIAAEGTWYISGGHEQIAKNITITVKDLVKKKDIRRKSFQKLHEAVKYSKGKVTLTVIDVTYDSDNKINSVVVEQRNK